MHIEKELKDRGWNCIKKKRKNVNDLKVLIELEE